MTIEQNLSDKLWCDLRTDEERSAWLLMGRGYETGVVAHAVQADLAMAYHRLALLSPAAPTQEPPDHAALLADEYQRWIDFYHAGKGDYADFLRAQKEQA